MITTEQQTRLLDEAFNHWWHNEGSGMPPLATEDHAEHARRIARIAWHNGACANHPLPDKVEEE